MVLSKELKEIKDELIRLNKNKESSLNLFNSIRNKIYLLEEIELITIFLDETYKEITIGQRLYHIRENLNDIEICPSCGEPKKFHRYSNGYFSTCGKDFCKKSIKVESFKKTIQKKYNGNFFKEGSEAKEKYKKTMLEKYGVDHNFKGIFREDIAKTMIEKYGNEIPLANKEIQEKRRKTCMEKHGTLNFIKGEKARKTNIENYGFENPMLNKEVSDKVTEKYIKTKRDILSNKLENYNINLINYTKDKVDLFCNNCIHDFTNHSVTINTKLRLNMNPCPYCNPRDLSSSNLEKEFIYFIKSIYRNEIKTNYRDLFRGNNRFSEVDLYLPDLKIAFEFNGIYWHSDVYKDTTYHKDKTNLLLNKGIKLYHIWEDDWLYKKDIIKSIISSILHINMKRIFARKCDIRNVKYKEYKDFCDNNHLKSFTNASYIIGLYYENDLVSIMSFNKTRKLIDSNKSEYEYEIIRSCSKLYYNIIGGYSKILKYFKDNISKSIVTYCDASLSPDPMNTVYNKIGMNYIKSTDCGFYWVIDGKRSNRLNWTKKKLIKMGYDKNKTGDDIMYDMGYYKIWDCGNHKYST